MMLRSLAILGCTFGAGALAMTMIRSEPAPTVTTIPVFLPTVAPVHVTVVQPAPAPLPRPPDPPPAPQPRPVAPVVDPACVLPEYGGEVQCAWDDKLPALSPDGRTVALRVIPDDGGRGDAGLTIRFIDVTTANTTDLPVLDPDENETTERPALQAKMTTRAIAIQAQLAGYRPLAPLGSARNYDDGTPTAPAAGTHAEFADDLVRIVDGDRQVWAGHVTVPAPGARSADDMCGGWYIHFTTAWWDPQTRTVLVAQAYRTGGCMCTDIEVDSVRRF